MSTPGRGDAASIGVGMGGSCPECRAPVDLGQEFCLECGAAIRVKPDKPRRRSPQQTVQMVVPTRRGFPWIPFLVVLALIITGSITAILLQDPPSRPKKKSAGVTTLETVPTTSGNVTVTGCNAGVTAQGTTPGVIPTVATTTTIPSVASTTFGTTATNSGVNTITTTAATSSTLATTQTTTQATIGTTTSTLPTATTSTSFATTQAAIPTTTSTLPGQSTQPVTVDENGNICQTQQSVTSTTTMPTTSGGTLSQTWPSGQSGWTVVLFSLSQVDYDQQYANERAAQAQADGVPAGVINTNDFGGLCPNLWYVFHGTYSSEAEAQAEQRRVATGTSNYQGAFVRQIATSGTPPSCPS